MNKTLMVLGASLYQLPFISAAKAMGWRVLSVDHTPTNPGHALSDESVIISTTDHDKIFAEAQRHKIDGITSPCTDIAVYSAAYVAQSLGLPGATTRAASLVTDRIAFRQHMLGVRQPQPDFLEMHSPIVAEEFLERHTAGIIKPNRSSGSRGVRILQKGDDIDEQFRKAADHSLDGRVILEEVVEGTQHTCEGLWQDGELVYAIITDRETVPHPETATLGHKVPTTLGQLQQEKIKDSISALLTSLDIQSTPFDCDLVAHPESAVILEISPRAGGNSLAKLISYASGIDFAQAVVRMACGLDIARLDPKPLTPTAVRILGLPQGGTLHYDKEIISFAASKPWVRSLILDCAPGSRIEPFTNGRNRFGEAVLSGCDRSDLDKNWRELLPQLRLSVV